MINGEFRRHDGLILPNSFTSFGRLEMLRMAMTPSGRAAVATGGNLYVGLCSGSPADGLQLESLSEPTIGVNGYSRIALSRDNTGWTTDGFVNNEAWIQSKDLVFAATGVGFNKGITRLFLCTSASAVVGNVISLGAAMPATLTIVPATSLVNRTFNYRIYNR